MGQTITTCAALEALSEEHPEGCSAVFLPNEQSVPDRERLDREYGRLNRDVLVVEFSDDVALYSLKLLPDARVTGSASRFTLEKDAISPRFLNDLCNRG
jgi:hypothetical protein